MHVTSMVALEHKTDKQVRAIITMIEIVLENNIVIFGEQKHKQIFKPFYSSDKI